MAVALPIEVRGLTKVYHTDFWKKPVTALRGLDLAVQPGEIFGFIGPNGAGKTTTIKVLVGLHRATEGSASLFGVDAFDPRARSRVGFLPERPYFYQHLTARELLDFYGELMDVPRPLLRKRAGELLERVDLHRAADTKLSAMSKGMLQRVGLAQALLNDPDLVILDEPMSGLDPMGRALVRDVILEERARGRTVFFSSHILHDVETLCSRVAVVVGGRLQGVGTVDALLGSQTTHMELVAMLKRPIGLPGVERRAESVGGRLRVHQELSPETLDAALQAIHAAEGQVLEVRPVRRTLEEVFLGAVAAAAPDGATGAQGREP